MKLSTSTGDFKRVGATMPERIRLIAEAGFKHINLELTDAVGRLDGDDWKDKIAAISAALNERGVDCVLAHATCENLNEATYDGIVFETLRDISACEALGIPDLVVHPLYPEGKDRDGVFDFNRAFYRDLIASSKGSPVRLLIENMADVECAVPAFATGEDMAAFLDYAKLDRLGACWDTAHGNLNAPPRDNQQYEAIIALGDRLFALHVSDNFGRRLHWHTFPFNGSINFDAVLSALVEIGYRGAFNFEASYIMRNASMPPVRRNRWTHPTDPHFAPKLTDPPLELILQAEKLLYATGKYLLEQYNAFED